MTDNMLRQMSPSSQEQKLFIPSLHHILFTSVYYLKSLLRNCSISMSTAIKQNTIFSVLRRDLSPKVFPSTVSFHFPHFALTLPYSNQASSLEFYFRAPAKGLILSQEIIVKEVLPFLTPKSH